MGGGLQSTGMGIRSAQGHQGQLTLTAFQAVTQNLFHWGAFIAATVHLQSWWSGERGGIWGEGDGKNMGSGLGLVDIVPGIFFLPDVRILCSQHRDHWPNPIQQLFFCSDALIFPMPKIGIEEHGIHLLHLLQRYPVHAHFEGLSSCLRQSIPRGNSPPLQIQ